MDKREIGRVRAELDEYVSDVFASLARRDQRTKGSLYLQGLMLDGRRKSMQPMGDRLGIDYQQLQQFVSCSPWPVEPVRRKLVSRAIDVIQPEAWVVDDTGFVKDGPASPGVARQYSGSLGKIGNVQIGVSVHAVTDQASCPLEWRLFLPEKWDDACAETSEEAEHIAVRRQRAKIPDIAGHQTKWEQALEMLDELDTWGYRPQVMVGDAGYGEIGPLRTGLTERQIPYVVQVKATTSVHDVDAPFELPDSTGKTGRPFTKPSYRTKPVQARQYAGDLPEEAFEEVAWRQGSKGVLTSRFAACRVRPANRNLPKDADGTLPVCWLLIEWPENEAEPSDYWLSTLPESTPVAELVRFGKIRWRIEHDYRELKHGLGLDHFEGRTWLGWHHHVTLVTAAHLFITEQRLRGDPKAGGVA
ncbi:IS701 family transposase [Corynebacterium pacaense]|uniref:IS701 family transposase n=1 Tax=Corynebacterium pacaense TaxID=1816684 RepID=UPI00117892BF|nr:IS701 family transposase [Corynebacterium pacaense]